MDKKIKILLALSVIILSATSILLAEDYPSSFLGPGYREYLNGKIQDGYYVDTFAKLDVRLKTRIDKRNQIEDILNSSYRARPETNYSILSAEYEKMENQQGVLDSIAKSGQEREKGAAANGEFYYIIHEDGKKEFFRDGLLWRIENELLIDQFGNSSRKDTYNIKYNEKRLMIGYESTSINAFGDKTYNSFECEYTADSVYYGANDTVANKLMSRYTMTEIDASGKKTVVSWTADGYVGKFLIGFREVVDSEVYGHSEVHRYDIIYGSGDPSKPTSYKEHGVRNYETTYDIERSNIQYLDLGEGLNPLMASWHEKYSDTDSNVSENDYTNEYYINGPNAILLSTTNQYTRVDVQGTTTTGWNKVLYTYDKNGVLESAIGYGEYSSTDVDGTTTAKATVTDTYEVIHGHAKVVKSSTNLEIKGPNGKTTEKKEQTFTYDQWGLHMTGSAGLAVGSTIGPDGNTTYFYLREEYDIIWGEAKIRKVTSYSYTFNVYNENPLGLGELDFEDLDNAVLLKQYLDNADSNSTSTKTFTYDANGRLQSVVGNVDTYVQTITGDISHTNIQEEYEIKYNQAFLDYQTIHTTGENVLGQESWESLEKLHYEYGEYTSSETGNSAGYALIGVNQEEVTLNGVTAVGKITITNNLFETTTTTDITQNTYEVKYGQSYIIHSVSVSETYSDLGSYTKKTQVSNFTYGWIEFQGEKYYACTSQNVSITSEGHDISGNSWHSTTPETYTLNFQLCTYGEREYWGIPEGYKFTTSYQIAGSDPYHNVYTETVNNSYEYKYGQPWLTESTSVRVTTDTRPEKSQERSTTTSTTTYTYGEITFGGKTYYGMKSYTFTTQSEGVDDEGKAFTTTAETYTLTYQECEYEGQKYWGVPEGTKITTTHSITSDGKTTTVTNNYEIKFGQLLLMKTVSVTDGETATTVNNYGWITYKGENYYAIVSQDYNMAGESFHLEFSAQTYNDVNYWGLEEGKTYTRVDVHHETQSGSQTSKFYDKKTGASGTVTTYWSVTYKITITKTFKIEDGGLKFEGASAESEVESSSVVSTVNFTVPVAGGGSFSGTQVYYGTINNPPVPGVSIPGSATYRYTNAAGETTTISITAPVFNYDPITGAFLSVTYLVNQNCVNAQGAPIWTATPTTIIIAVDPAKPYTSIEKDDNGVEIEVPKTTAGLSFIQGIDLTDPTNPQYIYQIPVTYTIDYADGSPSQTVTDTYVVYNGAPALLTSGLGTFFSYVAPVFNASTLSALPNSTAVAESIQASLPAGATLNSSSITQTGTDSFLSLNITTASGMTGTIVLPLQATGGSFSLIPGTYNFYTLPFTYVPPGETEPITLPVGAQVIVGTGGLISGIYLP